MSVGLINSIIALLSATTEASAVKRTMAVDIAFYVNLGLTFCALLAFTALVITCRKTTRADDAGITAATVFIIGLVAFLVQTILYVYVYETSAYSVYLTLAILFAGFVISAVYCFMLATSTMHKPLCIATGILCFVPPVGAIMLLALTSSLRRDTHAQGLVFDGYAFTYAALGGYCAKHPPEYIDGAAVEHYDELSPKDAVANIKKLKKQAKTPEGMFEYGTAIAHYAPQNMREAVSMMSKAANADYIPALFNLGYWYEIGLYVNSNLKHARDYYSRAAAAGDNDAALRLGILDMKEGKFDSGIAVFDKRAEGGDMFAKYDLALCYEMGKGTAQDIDKAIELYIECVESGLFEAEERLYALAAFEINSPQNGEFFRNVTDHKFSGTFAIMINGLIEIKKRHASDAASHFLQAVKCRGKWEGFARCILGTLYMDCGKLISDKRNGAAYIKSAMPISPVARDMYPTIPAKLKKHGK